MKKTLFSLQLIAFAYLVSAQSDTLSAPSAANDEPKIIYYQTTDPEPKKKERRKDIKTLSGSMSHSGGFGAISFRSSDFRDETLVMAGLRGGWIINRILALGIEGHGIIPTTKFDYAFDNGFGGIERGEMSLNGGYGGSFIELIFFSNEVVHVTFPVSSGAGWLGYLRTKDDSYPFMSFSDDEIDSEVFWYIEPGANLEFNLSRNFRLDFGVSKRFVQDLELLDTDKSEFENINFYWTLKIGGF